MSRGASILTWGGICLLAFQTVKSKRRIDELAGRSKPAAADSAAVLVPVPVSEPEPKPEPKPDTRTFLEKYSFALAPILLGAMVFFGSTHGEGTSSPAYVNAIGASVVAIGAALGMTAEYRSVPSLLPASWAFTSLGAAVVAFAGFFL